MNIWCICWFFVHPLNAELNPICHLLALLGGAIIVVVSRLRVNMLQFFFLPRHVLAYACHPQWVLVPDKLLKQCSMCTDYSPRTMVRTHRNTQTHTQNT